MGGGRGEQKEPKDTLSFSQQFNIQMGRDGIPFCCFTELCRGKCPCMTDSVYKLVPVFS